MTKEPVPVFEIIEIESLGSGVSVLKGRAYKTIRVGEHLIGCSLDGQGDDSLSFEISEILVYTHSVEEVSAGYSAQLIVHHKLSEMIKTLYLCRDM